MSKRLVSLFLCVMLVFLAGSLVLCEVTKTSSEHPNQDVMLAATQRAQAAFDAIKDYKVKHGIEIVEEDVLETGMLGTQFSYIATTEGVLESKRTTVNPHWAAVIVSMFVKADLHPGDQVLMVFSGSFPALNICAIAAGQEYGLDMCLMGSVGASHYGATNEEFTFFDMVAYLCGCLDEKPTEQIFDKSSMLDYVSLGGGNDCGSTFGSYMIWDDDAAAVGQEYASKITERIKALEDKGEVVFVNESNFENNMNVRLEYAANDVPNAKFVLNVGGSMVGLGIGLSAYIESGYRSPGIFVSNGALVNVDKNDGMLQRYLQQGVPVASMLNMQAMAETYGIVYNPTEQKIDTNDVSQANVYFISKYNPVIPVIAFVHIVLGTVLFCVLSQKSKTEVKTNERNHILR